MVPVVMDEFPLMLMDTQVMMENLAGEGISAGDLPSIHLPSGTGSSFELPNGESARTFKGIILAQFRTRAYWENPTPTAGTPPNCSGVFDMGDLTWRAAGDPGGPCDECPFNEFGSAGRGKACGESRLMILATDNSALPVVLRAPAGSLRASKRYMLGLTPLRYDQVVTQFSLNKEVNADGISYCSLVMEKVGVLAPSDTEGVRNAALAFKSTIDGLSSLPAIAVTSMPIEEDAL